MDLHVNDMCTRRLPCRASGRMHKSDKGHPSDHSSSELTDEVVNTATMCRRGEKKKENISYTAKKAKKRKTQAKETIETVADKKKQACGNNIWARKGIDEGVEQNT